MKDVRYKTRDPVSPLPFLFKEIGRRSEQQTQLDALCYGSLPLPPFFGDMKKRGSPRSDCTSPPLPFFFPSFGS